MSSGIGDVKTVRVCMALPRRIRIQQPPSSRRFRVRLSRGHTSFSCLFCSYHIRMPQTWIYHRLAKRHPAAGK